MEQNETGCQTPQAPIFCANGCGFFGTAATMNMCSKCYKDVVLKQEQAEFAASSIQSIVNGSSSAAADKAASEGVAVAEKAKAVTSDVILASSQTPSAGQICEKKEEVKEGPKRCGTCNKRVGLTGFKCRCGSLLCAVHRYSDKHECLFDYRTAGQEAIAKANPVVKAEKLDKI